MNDIQFSVIKNGTVLTPEKEIKDGVVIITNGKIVAVGKRGEIDEPQGAEIIDAGGNYISPGFIDIHINGANGADVSKIDSDTFDTMGSFFPQYGTTAYVGTTITAAPADILKALQFARSYLKENKTGVAELLGIHMEGPYISPVQSGAHPKQFLALPEPEHYMPFLEYSDVLVKMTIAPELKGAAQLVKELRKRNIVVSAGHTNGIYSEMKEAIDAGVNHATHFFCNMSHFRRDNLKRVAGVVETLLYDDRVSGALIGDGWHVGPQLMKLLVKVKGVDKVCFVTDAMPAVGLPDGIHKIGDVEAVVENGIARLQDNTAYAGSVTTMNVCVRNGINQVDLSMVDAVRMSSLTPAKIIGVAHKKGSLEKGKDADITIFDSNINIKKTIVRGEVIF
jgi:N-acetylglucosamine-6-phosphate deacetylase